MTAQVAYGLELTGAIAPVLAGVSESVGRSFDLTNDPANGVLWQSRASAATPQVSLAQLREARAIDDNISAGAFGELGYKVLASKQPGVFSLGGDLAFFCQCIEANDRATLSEYAVLAAKAVWANASAYGPKRIKSISVVQGEAQGGGFEAALSCNTIIAERGTSFGFPESLFGMFPGMGGEVLLASRVDREVASRIVESSGRYAAEFLFEIGVVDYLAAPGAGLSFVSKLLAQARSEPLGEFSERINARQQQLDEIRYDTLADSIERWVDQALTLSRQHVRAMKYIIELQGRRTS